MKSPRPDRVPTFDPSIGRWRWWSDSPRDSTVLQDQESADRIPATWEREPVEGERINVWRTTLPALPGFAPFLWTIREGWLLLRRPEGTWKVALPAMARQDILRVDEQGDAPHDGMLRHSLYTKPGAKPEAWHVSYSDEDMSLEEQDRRIFGTPVFLDGQPVMMSGSTPSRIDGVEHGRGVFMPLLCRPGTLSFEQRRVVLSGKDQHAVLVHLPNGLRFLHAFGRTFERLNLNRARLTLVMGDADGAVWQSVPITVSHDETGIPLPA